MPWPDLSLMVKQVRYFAETMPDTVNQLCRYVDDTGQPSCIIGHALIALGFETDWYQRETDEAYVFNDAGLHQLLPTTGYPAASEDPRIRWLMDVQDFQDGQTPWMKAVELADEEWGHVA
jgi:hypothetical protein